MRFIFGRYAERAGAMPLLFERFPFVSNVFWSCHWVLFEP
jgi:hypothetical protein